MGGEADDIGDFGYRYFLRPQQQCGVVQPHVAQVYAGRQFEQLLHLAVQMDPADPYLGAYVLDAQIGIAQILYDDLVEPLHKLFVVTHHVEFGDLHHFLYIAMRLVFVLLYPTG